MEAEIFQEISQALQGRNKHIMVPVENISPIQKIIWSSFDYMAGPELRFVWEANYLKQSISNAPIKSMSTANKIIMEQQSDIDNDIETVDGCVSSNDSSFSKNTGGSSTTRDQFEDIDAYNSELLQLSSERYDNIDINSDWNLNSLAKQSGGSTSQTQSTLIETEWNQSFYSNAEATQQKNQFSTPSTAEAKLEAAEAAQFENENEMLPTDDTMIISCVDSGIAGTVSLDSNLSSIATQDPKEKVMYKASGEFCKIRLDKNQHLNIREAEEVIEFDYDAYSEATGAEETARSTIGRNTQCSMIGSQFGSSFYSSCSVSNPIFQSTPQHSRERSIIYEEAELLATELSSAESLGNMLSDEAFVAKQVLAEQIGSIQLTSNPIVHKFCIVPFRHIAFGSYIFSTREHGQSMAAAPNLSAFSILVPIERAEWFLQRQFVFQEIFSDIIARFKVAHLVEDMEDLICRCTREFSNVFLLFGALERWPLASSEITKLRIQSTHLWELRKEKNEGREFLVRCITAALVCRGKCTLVGSNSKEVLRLMMTLCAFLRPDQRSISLKPHKLQFSPYLGLQAIKRSEVYQFFHQAANSHWPCSLLDLDRKSVIYTGLYHKHRTQKKLAQLLQISQIFREAVESGLTVPANILTALDQQLLNGSRAYSLETHIIHADPTIYDFMDQICLLPLNRAARISFVDHLHLRLENCAKSLISFVRDISMPSPGDKRSALSSKWHLATVRRNLNLHQDSAYGIALAMADSLQSGFAEFIAQQTTTAGRHLNH